MSSKKPNRPFVRTCLAIGKAASRGFARLDGYLSSHRSIRALGYFAILFVMFWLVGWMRLDPDFGWHLQAGNYIRAHGVPSHDIFTYTARSYRWIDHEWGNDVILSWLYGFGGYGLLAALYASLWSLALLIAGSFRARLIVLVAAAVAINPYAGIRPVVWTAFLFVLVLGILRSPRQHLRYYLPLLFIAWANFHAGFIAGLAIVGYFAVRERKLSIAWQLLLCVLATFINPYGPRLYAEIARTLFDPALHGQIQEWAYLSIPKTSWLFLVLWLTGFWIFDRKHWKRWFGISPLLLVTTLSATRNLPLFVIAAVRELDYYLSRGVRSIPKKLDRSRETVLGLLIGGMLIALLYTFYAAYWPLPKNREAHYPSQAVAYLQSHPCRGNLFNSYNYGGYLIWKLPGQPVYIDGRMPTWQPYMDRYEAITHAPATHYPQQFQRYNIRCVLIMRTSTSKDAELLRLLQKAHWRTAVQTNSSILLLAPT